MLTNEDLKLLIRIEHFIGCNIDRLLGETGVWDGSKDLNEFYKGDDTWTFSRDNFEELYNLIERIKLAKKQASDKVNEYHKRNPEKHREYNREWARKKKLLNNNKKGQ